MKKEILSIALPVFMLLGINTPAQAEPCTTKVNRICNFVFPKDGTVETEESYSTCQSIGQGWCGDGQSQRVQEFSLKNAVIKSPKKMALKIQDSRKSGLNRGGIGGFQSPDGLPDEPPFPTDDNEADMELAFLGYACEVTSYPVGNNLHKNIKTIVYSEPSCQGEYVGTIRTCVYNVTDTTCFDLDDPSAGSYQYPAYMMDSMYDNLVQALRTGLQLRSYRSTWNSTSVDDHVGQQVFFTARP